MLSNSIYLRTILSIFLVSISTYSVSSATEVSSVKITAEMPYLNIMVDNKKIQISRIQEESNRLSNSFSKTSRKCPPFCIHAFKIGSKVKTVGELEVLTFLKDKVMTGTGALVDSRIPQWFEKGTIPGAVNIPFTLLNSKYNKKYSDRILQHLGVSEGDGGRDYSQAKELIVFCNGSWCSQATRAIENLIDQGYPEEKLYWYRGGIQNWLLLGMTTISD